MVPRNGGLCSAMAKNAPRASRKWQRRYLHLQPPVTRYYSAGVAMKAKALMCVRRARVIMPKTSFGGNVSVLMEWTFWTRLVRNARFYQVPLFSGFPPIGQSLTICRG